jgi:N-acetyl-gamma-glutamyl-phosphate reductase
MNPGSTVQVGVLGASGYAGAELLRLASCHPYIDVVFGSSETRAGTSLGDLYPSLASSYPDLTLRPWEEVPDGLDTVFLAMPHGVSQSVVPRIRDSFVVDLGGDFRFHDVATFEAWYGRKHQAPDLVSGFTYGLVELFRNQILSADAVSVPGCYATTVALTLAPLLGGGVVEPTGIVVDAASGVSGAGREPKPATMFSSANEDFTAYGLLNHRHTPEMQMALSKHSGSEVELLFTPHLAPMSRGILATCYLRPTGGNTTDELLSLMADFYVDEPFVVVSERIPSTKATTGSNSVHMTVRKDERTGWILAIGALDNLVKGAAGQAIQNLNVHHGFIETTGLDIAGVYP